ncbi:hypothetical protein [Methyloglobulus sp.]|uniref:hypothetical protein n=1 Tax=Methyloglobulus sp. TaxID=2518622 RepID=UPI0032B839E9
MKNIAGNAVSLFLFRFELRGKDGIDFVLNEAIAADMYQEIDDKIKPLVHACCETLLRYRHLSVGNTIMDGNFLVTGEFEVMLSKGLGRHFGNEEKERLFQDAKNITDLLGEVMDRGTQEENEGKQRNRPPIELTPNPSKIKKGLEELGKAKSQQAELQWIAEGQQIRPGLKPLRPDDLPRDVTASRGYDHRGFCYVFEHKKYGELGRIVMIKAGEKKMLMQADLCLGREKPESTIAKKKKEIFEKVVTTVTICFDVLDT